MTFAQRITSALFATRYQRNTIANTEATFWTYDVRERAPIAIACGLALAALTYGARRLPR